MNKEYENDNNITTRSLTQLAKATEISSSAKSISAAPKCTAKAALLMSVLSEYSTVQRTSIARTRTRGTLEKDTPREDGSAGLEIKIWQEEHGKSMDDKPYYSVKKPISQKLVFSKHEDSLLPIANSQRVGGSVPSQSKPFQPQTVPQQPYFFTGTFSFSPAESSELAVFIALTSKLIPLDVFLTPVSGSTTLCPLPAACTSSGFCSTKSL